MKKNNVVGINEMTVAARKSLYEAVKRNLNPLFEVDGVVIAKTGAIPIELLEIDPAYQGDRRHTKINRLVANFDYRKLDLITVVPHDETCLFEVVDGQGRTMAANIVPEIELLAVQRIAENAGMKFHDETDSDLCIGDYFEDGMKETKIPFKYVGQVEIPFGKRQVDYLADYIPRVIV